MDDQAHRPNRRQLGGILAALASVGAWRDAGPGWVPAPPEPDYPVPPHTMDPEQNALDRFQEQLEFEEYMREFQERLQRNGRRDS